MVERGGERGLENVVGGVGKVVGQLDVMTETAVAVSEVVARDALHAAVGEHVVGRLVTPVALEVLVAEVIGQCQLAVARVVFAIDGVAAPPAGQEICGIQAQVVALAVAAGADDDDKLDAVAVAHTGVVDILDTADVLRVESCQVVGCGLGAVDAYLHAAIHGHGGDGACDSIHLESLHGHHGQQLIDVGRVLELGS